MNTTHMYNTSVEETTTTTMRHYMESEDPSDDAVWILSSTFIIFTMQSGFGLLESGSVTAKNEVNIMVKNAVDVIVGGFTYWAFGYALSFGPLSVANGFCGWGLFFVESEKDRMGEDFSHFFFQSSFATTATTIVSGAMAERTKMESYIVFSALNTLIYCFPAHWVWADKGWLRQMGLIDVAGDGPVHLVGGITGLVATLMLKPRHKRYDQKTPPPMGSPTNALLGMFMLWWGWLGFNCGSTFGISGMKWKLAARSAVATLCASVGGGTIGTALSYIFKRRKIDVSYLINGILGALVSITGLCALSEPWEGTIIGAIGAVLTLASIELLDRLKVDDPVGCVGVHAVGGTWGLLAAGLFTRPDQLRNELWMETDNHGILWGGSGYLLAIQLLGVVVITTWTAVTSFLFLKLIDVTVGLRMSLENEILGADLVEHDVGEVQFDKVRGKMTAGMKSVKSSDTARVAFKSSFNKTRKDRQRNIHQSGLRRATQFADDIGDVIENIAATNGNCVRADNNQNHPTPNSIFDTHYGDVPPLLPNKNLNNNYGKPKLQKKNNSLGGKFTRKAKTLSFRVKSRNGIRRRGTINIVGDSQQYGTRTAVLDNDLLRPTALLVEGDERRLPNHGIKPAVDATDRMVNEGYSHVPLISNSPRYSGGDNIHIDISTYI